jgi:hypothetical protein
VNWHSVDKCFCLKCSRILKEYLENYKVMKTEEERLKIGIISTNTNAVTKTTSSKKIKLPFIRVLKEEVLK